MRIFHKVSVIYPSILIKKNISVKGGLGSLIRRCVVNNWGRGFKNGQLRVDVDNEQPLNETARHTVQKGLDN